MKRGILLFGGLMCLAALAACGLFESAGGAKVADCTVPEVRFTRRIDAGNHFQLVLGVPRSSQLPPSFKGDLVISKAGARIGEYPIGSDDMKECNWLHDAPELQGYILTSRHASSAAGLDRFLKTGSTYDFVVKFSEMPPAGSSLWLSWLQ